MSLKDKNIRVFIATPGCGKSYLADRYENVVDVDELRLMHKYIVPNNISRECLEATKGDRDFEKRKDYHKELDLALSQLLIDDKIILIAPHSEIIDFFINKNESMCFVYPELSMKEEMIARFFNRGNSKNFIEENTDVFEKFYNENIKDNKAKYHIVLKEKEYLSDVLIKEGYTLIPKKEFKVNNYYQK